jgi:hypothetical protein
MIRLFKLSNIRTLAGSGSLAFSLLAATLIAVIATMMTITPQESTAKPAYSAATGSPCTACHTAPPKLNECGEKYAKDKTTKC